MSRLEIYALRTDGTVAYYDRCSTSFGGAWHIWTTLAQVYGIPHGLSDFEPVWRSIQRMTVRDQWVLASTFDHVIMGRVELPLFIAHLADFVAEHPSPTLHCEHGMLLRMMDDPALCGVAFNQTSVAESLWTVWDDERDEGRSYNIETDRGHWFLTADELRTMHVAEVPR